MIQYVRSVDGVDRQVFFCQVYTIKRAIALALCPWLALFGREPSATWRSQAGCPWNRRVVLGSAAERTIKSKRPSAMAKKENWWRQKRKVNRRSSTRADQHLFVFSINEPSTTWRSQERIAILAARVRYDQNTKKTQRSCEFDVCMLLEKKSLFDLPLRWATRVFSLNPNPSRQDAGAPRKGHVPGCAAILAARVRYDQIIDKDPAFWRSRSVYISGKEVFIDLAPTLGHSCFFALSGSEPARCRRTQEAPHAWVRRHPWRLGFGMIK